MALLPDARQVRYTAEVWAKVLETTIRPRPTLVSMTMKSLVRTSSSHRLIQGHHPTLECRCNRIARLRAEAPMVTPIEPAGLMLQDKSLTQQDSGRKRVAPFRDWAAIAT